MADNRQYTALEWVVKEIKDTLTEAQRVLEIFSQDSQDRTQMRFCQTLIHQVNGSLEMIGFHGAAMLAEEMEILSVALLDDKLNKSDDALEVLMRSIIQLPNYLEQVQETKQDYPAVVLSLLNDIRSVRGASLLSESSLFSPDLSPAIKQTGQLHEITNNSAQFKSLIDKLRQMYRYAAASLINQIKIDESLTYLFKVSTRLNKVLRGSYRSAVWEIASALIEGIQTDAIKLSPSIKSLLQNLDSELKQIQTGGIESLSIPTSTELLKNLLYYISVSEKDSPLISKVKKRYKLHEMLPVSTSDTADSSSALPVDSSTTRAVANAIREEFSQIKEKLDACLNGADSNQYLDKIQNSLQRVNDALAILGVGEIREMLSDCIQLISTLNQEETLIDGQELLEVAHKLVDIESKLDPALSATHDSSSSYQLDEAQSAVLGECRNGLEKSKDSIVDYIATKWNVEKLHEVPNFMRQVRGNLSILALNKAADILSACILYIEKELIDLKVQPKWQQLDSLADVIASVDYYLEFMSAAKENDESILEKAEAGLRFLGVTKGSVEAITPTSIDKPEPTSIDPIPFLDSKAIEQESEPTEIPSLSENIPTLTSPEEASSEEANAVTEIDEDDFIDDELKEIFIEEVGEINQRLAEFFPQWSEDYDKESALIETRRAFHTLKGSGRMVKADDIGELAWSIENMLNRVLDNTIIPDQHMVVLIEKVIAIVPDMIVAFSKNHANPLSELSDQYQSWAHNFANNKRDINMLQALIPEEIIATDDSVEVDDSEQEQEIDTQLWEIFQSEAQGHLLVVTDFLEQMSSKKPFYEPPSDPMQRALHTLKGSAHMAEFTPIAELMTPLEKFAKELRSYQVNIDDDIFQLFTDGVNYTEEAISQIEELQFPEIIKLDQFLARINELRERSVGSLVRLEKEAKAQQKVDPAVLEVLMAEEMDLLLDADLMIEEWKQEPATQAQWQSIRDELATLYHGADRANLQSMANLSHILQQTYNGLIDGAIEPSNDNYDLLLSGHNELMNTIDAIAAGQDLPPENADLLDALLALPATKVDELDSSDSVQNFEAQDLHSITEAEPGLQEKDELEDKQEKQTLLPDDNSVSFAEDPIPEELKSADESLQIDYQEIEADQGEEQGLDSNDEKKIAESDFYGSAANSLQDEFSTNIEEPEKTLESTIDENDVDIETVEIFLEEADELIEEIDEIVNDWETGVASEVSNEAIQRALHTFKGGARLAGLNVLGDLAHDFEAYLIDNIKAEDSGEVITQVHVYQDKLIEQVSKVKPDQFDISIQDEPSNEQDTVPLIDQPEIEHDVVDIDETYGELSQDENKQDKSDLEKQDQLKGSPNVEPEATNIIPFSTSTSKKTGLTILKEVLKPSSPNPAIPINSPTKRTQPQETVKVSADLMEELVNLAGETSISRGRMEEQVNDLGYAIEEMGSTVQRLQDQLRRLDIETEAQMVFRQEQMQELDDFDPLEMDRYSHLQQLSRSLIESASDLMDLKNTLVDKTRDTETVLLQQSRINTDLQEGLMRSRMVPFSRIVPRLRRIVRQISSELNKDVNLELGNIEGELDRSMMERMVAPLEHMLRNAIDHGIEDVKTRLSLDKPASGRIVITLDRDGGDVLVLVADDGQGIDVDRVRDKAVERNLINVDADLGDQEILQFILHAGFSTAETVTQISGRGVGMDVVNSEIRQMGGSIGIDSRPSEGTAFTIRLPFTVSVNRALMVTMGDVRYAIPLNTIEGIVRISPFELEHYYANPEEPFEYANQEYQLRHLGSLLDHNSPPRILSSTLPLPVLLVRSADHSVAVQVDNLQGSREIVVKSLGSQFRSVLGVSGATIMGDGNVVVILDINALIRSNFARSLALPTFENNLLPQETIASNDRNSLVMVVDDSVTVRKVTTRLLEREGYDVITAKDGVDAMVILQEKMPDIMLLDIEMPRMDGFEVAKNVRSSEHLQHLPIIMITSRTGEKHRQRGLESGANLYMGKPYQEEALLEGISGLIGTSTAQIL